MAIAHLNNLEIKIAANFEFGVTNKTPEYLAKFPMGQIPSLETASGFCLSEGVAICHYLACSGPKRTQLLGSTPEEEAWIQMWVSLGEGEILAPTIPIALSMLGHRPYIEYEMLKSEEAMMRGINRVELYLQDHEWLCGSTGLNLGDISVAASLYFAFMHLLDGERRAKLPKVVDWYKRMFELDEGVREAFGGEPRFCEQRLPPFPTDGAQGSK